ncbi:tol-pal system protein YbgF [Aurantimonas sp. MSK8Z-1]|uniref:tol-pal system protein YbgF n=1 Tax=Mangrovibrevibacter kandeliae TaxID=2968473 RepID=UPI0021179ECE|nr:tol-pal system protein YbgF [Aurantimonas sp. MSK8Z-1]MCW4116917.1 tol-pal system protein YbgF [Aurantimonas sp. MSK8Z-1]
MALRNTVRLAAIGLSLAAACGPASALNLPFGLGAERSERAAPVEAPAEKPVLLAQADSSVRISQLEEEVRRLTGKVEELSFQLLQMQEQMRKQQEDNEFRFQDLEGNASGAGQKRTEAAPAPAQPTGSDVAAAAPPPAAPRAAAQAPATPPADGGLGDGGDQIGQILEAPNLDLGAAAAAPSQAPGVSSDTVASIDPKTADDLYTLAYNYMLAGDYQLAEQSFRQYAQTYPGAKDVPDAQYWLGESLFAQKKYTDAAEVFLNAQKQYPKSGKAPEMMLKLGMSLAKLDNRETACVTYAEVSKRYPSMSAAVQKKLSAEKVSAHC